MAAHESPQQVEQWLRSQADGLWPAALGSLSLRKSRCVRPRCNACRTGVQHSSHVLYGRIGRRRLALYVPEDLVPEVERLLDNGRAFQELLYQTAERYVKALKQQRDDSRTASR